MKENSDILRYLSAYLQRWIKVYGLTQTNAAIRLGIDQSQLNGILSLTKGISIEKMEKLCLKTGKKPLAALLEGQKITGEAPKKEDKNEPFADALNDFRTVLLHGGEAAETLTKAISDLAAKKKAAAKSENPTMPKFIKSA